MQMKLTDVCGVQDPTHKKKGQGSTISGHSLAVDEWRASVAFSISPLLSYSSDVVPATATATAPAAATAATAADTKPPALGTRPRQASQVGMKGKDDIITANLNNPSTPPVATATAATAPAPATELTSKEKEDEKKREKEREREEKKEKRASTKSKRSSATFSAASILTSKDKQEKEKEKAAAAASAAAAAQPAVSAPVPAAAVAVAAATDLSGPAGLPATTTLINFEKYSLVAAKVTELLACQSSSYCFEEVEFIQRWLGKMLGECLDEEAISATAKTLNDKAP